MRHADFRFPGQVVEIRGGLVRKNLAGVVLAMSLAMTACGGSGDDKTSSGSSSTPKAGGEITVASPLAPSSLDPIAGSSGGDQMSLYPIFDRLVNFDPETLAPQPGLATAWDYPDPKTLVLTLQDGVTFQDGTPFNAEAVKANLERALDPETSVVASDLSMIDSIEATGDLEATIHLNRPDASLVLILADRAGMMVSPTAVEKEGTDFALQPVGTGAYSFDKYVAGSELVLKKNADYWQEGKPYLDQITFKYFTDQKTANNALQAKQADIVLNADLADVSSLENMTGVKVASAPSLLTDGCYFNFSRAPFDDVSARQAVAYAIDRDAMNKAYAFGEAEPTSNVFPAGYWAADPSLQETFAFDADKARDLLAEAGHGDGLSIKAVTFQDTGEVRKAEIIQQQLKEVGIDMKFDVFDPATVAEKFFTNKEYDMACASWSGRPDPSQTASSLFSSTSFYNAGGYAAPGMDDALAAAASAQTQEERAAAFGTVTSLNQENVLWVPFLSEPNVTAINENVGGLVTNLYGKIDVSFLWVG